MRLDTPVEFSLSRPFPFGRLWHLSSVVLGAVVFAVVAVWAAATAGYETISTLSGTYNTTQADSWASAFVGSVTASNRRICQPAMIAKGQTVYLSNGLFAWTVLANRPQSNEGGSGVVPTPGTDADTAPYTGTPVNRCEVDKVFLSGDLATRTLSARVDLKCGSDSPWKAYLQTTVVTSSNPFFISGNTAGPRHDWSDRTIRNHDIFVALQHLGQDFISSMALREMGATTAQTYPKIMSSVAQVERCVEGKRGPFHCTVVDDLTGPSACFSQYPSFRWQKNMTFVLDSAGVIGDEIDMDRDAILFNNLACGLISAVRWDIGNTGGANIFTNPDALADQVRVKFPFMTGAGAILDPSKISGWSLPHQPPSTVDVQFMCEVSRIKPASAFIVSVAGLTLSLFGALWAGYKFLAELVGGRMSQYAGAFEPPAFRPAGVFALPHSTASTAFLNSDSKSDSYSMKTFHAPSPGTPPVPSIPPQWQPSLQPPDLRHPAPQPPPPVWSQH